MSPLVVGIFVGGQGRRMGGVPKGLLIHEGRPLVERLAGACRAAAAPTELAHLYLVGAASAYAATGLPNLSDDPPGLGPIGGLRALLLRARDAGADAVAIAVDLPYLGAALVRRLYSEQPGAALLAPREGGRWQPLMARYRPEVVLPAVDAALAADRRSLQSVFEILEARAAGGVVSALPLKPDEQLELRDWDRPSDMTASVPQREP